MLNTSIPKHIYQVLGDGARSNKYDVLITLQDPNAGVDGRTIGMLCKAASFPGRVHETIDFVYKGRSIPIRGQSSYEQEWTAQFYLTENHELRNQFLLWIEALDETHSYVGDNYASNMRQQVHEGYNREFKIYQQNFDDTRATAEYTLYNVFPKTVAPIDLNGAETGSLLEYQVTFAYSHFTTKILDKAITILVDNALESLATGAVATANKLINQFSSSSASQIGGSFIEGNFNLPDVAKSLLNGQSASTKSDFEKLIKGEVNTIYNPDGWMTEISNSIGGVLTDAMSAATNAISSLTKKF